jgi:hypothetical protein
MSRKLPAAEEILNFRFRLIHPPRQVINLSTSGELVHAGGGFKSEIDDGHAGGPEGRPAECCTCHQ